MGIVQVDSLRALPQPKQELALERHASSYSAPDAYAFVAKETLAPVAVPRYGESEAFFMF